MLALLLLATIIAQFSLIYMILQGFREQEIQRVIFLWSAVIICVAVGAGFSYSHGDEGRPLASGVAQRAAGAANNTANVEQDTDLAAARWGIDRTPICGGFTYPSPGATALAAAKGAQRC